MKKIFFLILILLISFEAFSVQRIYDRNIGDVIDPDKDDAEWDNTNNAINALQTSTNTALDNHIADVFTHDATGGIVGVTKSQTLTNKSFGGDTSFLSGSDLNFYSGTTSGILIISLNGATGQIVGAPSEVGINNLSLLRATTSVAGDSVTLSCGESACSQSNPGYAILNSTATFGKYTIFRITADVTLDLTGTHWGANGLGDIAGRILRVFLINDAEELKVCVGLLGGRQFVQSGDTSTSQSDIDNPEDLLCNNSVGVTVNSVLDIGYVKVNFDDSGGSSDNLNIVQPNMGDVVTGKTADGIWQPFTTAFGGFSSDPGINLLRWTQHGLTVHFQTDISAVGVSNATTFTMRVPVKANGVFGGAALQPVDNGINGGQPAAWRTVDDSYTISIFRTSNDDQWTAAGTKNAEPFGTYEAMQ